jgi:hypothetical protein
MFSEGTQVEIQFPGPSAGRYPVGRVAGFYSNEPRRAVVVLPSGEALVVMETDLRPATEWREVR